MAYIRQNFSDGQVLKAEHLNHIEDGIEEIYNNGSYTLTDADKTAIVNEVIATLPEWTGGSY